MEKWRSGFIGFFALTMLMINTPAGAENSAQGNDLRGSMAMRGPVHLVLDGLEEPGRCLDRRVVVDAGGVDIQYLAPEHLLGGTDVADAAE